MRFGFPRWTRKQDPSARAAKERLQVLLAHERAGGPGPDVFPELQRDILAVIKRHMKIDDDAVDIQMERGEGQSSLEINIELPAARG
ncbi:Cell division topological specificity factor [Roseivivax jejudonensis]|uniref:Cell division topological specificity factor n=2 Tax=Roseivivax jejudonensis TaxID=1529041 RepID=A0A1X6YTQ1_9RHOB|nr:Cell division topological specificity factor [Roseivivax jejudonensis]